ncbi:type II toxin-antitoxin system VapC family toxin [Brevibacterium litoralis]|uniref:type II toxin-antitoxin system VapC family toxin n=1 Tax=Brevibacterium litoralis TaxID=3138935 RepID=UPI0032F07FCC
MIVDTSAIIALVHDEPTAEHVYSVLSRDPDTRMSAATRVELTAVISRYRSPALHRHVDRLLAELGVRIEAFDSRQAEAASAAYRDFGKVSGHPARLNMGDCYSYALASVSGEPLVYVGDDFTHTDVKPGL